MGKKHIRYKVMFDDGDIDIELYPDENETEDYDSTNLKKVIDYAQQFKDARILKVTEEEIDEELF